jgi:hypothetical protein
MARSWLASLWSDAQPLALCQKYPRIANRLALCWEDRVLAARVLEGLVIDRRSGRAGFPAEVTKDLLKLRMLRPMTVTEKFEPRPSSPWDSENMAVNDR